MIHVREDREAEGKEGRILVVENLPDSYSWQELKDMFNEAGSKVAHADVIEKNGTRCGIVEFKTIHDASTALRNSSLIAVEDMLIRKPHFGEELKPENRRKVYVGQLAWSVAWQDLKDHFRSIGEVVRADVSMEPGSQRSNGYGFVEFASEDDADRAIRELNNTILRGRQIYVREYRD
jgi:RNA recognition motif-containing protein